MFSTDISRKLFMETDKCSRAYSAASSKDFNFIALSVSIIPLFSDLSTVFYDIFLFLFPIRVSISINLCPVLPDTKPVLLAILVHTLIAFTDFTIVLLRAFLVTGSPESVTFHLVLPDIALKCPLLLDFFVFLGVFLFAVLLLVVYKAAVLYAPERMPAVYTEQSRRFAVGRA